MELVIEFLLVLLVFSTLVTATAIMMSIFIKAKRECNIVYKKTSTINNETNETSM